MTDSGSQELPFRLSIEGRIDPDKLPDLVAAISEVAVGVQVNVEAPNPSAPPEAAPSRLVKEDFQNRWNPTGAARAWNALVGFTQEHEDFPLRRRKNQTETDYVVEGDIQEALDWLRTNPPKGRSGSKVLVTILEKMAEAQSQNEI